KRAGTTITVSVVSDAQGRYSFPANRLEPGPHALKVRAAGYVLEGSGSVTIGAQKNATADLKLRKATADETASQLSDSEWLMSWPGTLQQKNAVRGCIHCHTYERIMRSRYDATAMLATIERMSRYSPSSFPLMMQQDPTRRIGPGPSTPESRERLAATRKMMSEYLSGLNLNGRDSWPYEFKTLPRPAGKATRVVYTEYDLPERTRQPPDVAI